MFHSATVRPNHTLALDSGGAWLPAPPATGNGDISGTCRPI
eukprot:COSAG04_NODE_21685_length_369_cov_0.944444_1_plen_40_part_01